MNQKMHFGHIMHHPMTCMNIDIKTTQHKDSNHTFSGFIKSNQSIKNLGEV